MIILGEKIMKLNCEDHQTFRLILETNINIYRFLLLLLRKPSKPELFQEITNRRIMQGLHQIFREGRVLEDFFAQIENENWEDIKNEYIRLFCGSSHIVVPPWESYYCDDKNLLFGKSTYQFRILLSRFGKEYKWKHKTPGDHIIVELEFCLYLLEESLEQLVNHEEIENKYLVAYAEMLNKHLVHWIPKFCERIRKNSLFDLYIGTAYLLEKFIVQESKHMQKFMQLDIFKEDI